MGRDVKTITIAFDIDGTLRDNTVTEKVLPNQRIVDLLIILRSFKNVRIIVWSGGGKQYAEKVCKELKIEKYVHEFRSKIVTWEDPWGVHNREHMVDIAIDDIQHCELGLMNLICREK